MRTIKQLLGDMWTNRFQRVHAFDKNLARRKATRILHKEKVRPQQEIALQSLANGDEPEQTIILPQATRKRQKLQQN